LGQAELAAKLARFTELLPAGDGWQTVCFSTAGSEKQTGCWQERIIGMSCEQT
jgi:hypothetical protein